MNIALRQAPPFVCSTIITSSGHRYTVLVAGEYYVVNKWLLGQLRDGKTPAALGLEPAENDE